jgi:hypothetical protein
MTPAAGRVANTRVLFGVASSASDRSLPTLLAFTSKAALISMSDTWYPPTRGWTRPGIAASSAASR